MTDAPETPETLGGIPGAGPAADGVSIGEDVPAGRTGLAVRADEAVPEAGAGEAFGGPAEARAGEPAAAQARARAALARFAGGWPLGRIIGVGTLIAALFSLLAIVIGGAALADLSSARDRVVVTLDPAAFHASQLEVALLNQETGVRGYALSGRVTFLAPYTLGVSQQRHETSVLRPLLAGIPGAPADLARVLTSAAAWRVTYAQPTIRQVSTTGKPLFSSAVSEGKDDFDTIRATLSDLQGNLARQRVQAVASLNHSAVVLDAACVGIAIALLLVVTGFAAGLWRSAILPLSRLAADARQVAGGDFGHEVGSPGGPKEVRAVGMAVDSMRRRILADLSVARTAHEQLQARTEDLQRSNAELEQFAYVASHDLQEPLRKVASFCQLLQRRYAGQLDARADEYIEHAVDGAKRMQALINDLLAFSRVGRTAQHREPVSCGLLLAQAWANLGAEVRRSHATIEVGDLPVVLAEASLLTAVFQNLLSNALKFHGDAPPRVSVSARPDGRFWLFTVSDNGIGIEPEYAERIFVIFQRLHDRATYPGTGIGLAMVRKIIEYHGGRVWLDTTATAGARFCFTLPVLSDGEAGHD
jgi:signal transduction histidine kinase